VRGGRPRASPARLGERRRGLRPHPGGVPGDPPRDGAGGAGEASPRPRGTPRETALYKEVHKAPKAVKMVGGPKREGL